MAAQNAVDAERAPLRLAVLGCGAVTEILHLPAARLVPEVEVVALVDRDLERARALGSKFGVADIRGTYDGLSDEADAVLVALPNHLHAAASIEFLMRGTAVLVEKPMAMSADEARAMVSAADRGGAQLHVALMNRFANGARLVKQIIEQGTLGPITSFTILKGENFGWPLATGSGMLREEAGGGVLMDFGSHLLDLLVWWLGEPTLERYWDDSRGGVEADCELALSAPGPFGPIPGEARFSRLRDLGAVARIVGDRLTVEWEHRFPDAVRVWPTDWEGEPPRHIWEGGNRQSLLDLYVEQLRAFARAVTGETVPIVDGASAVPSMALIEECYRRREPVQDPWDEPVFVPGAAVRAT